MPGHTRNILLPVLCIAAGYFFYGCRHADEKRLGAVRLDSINEVKSGFGKDTILYSELKSCKAGCGEAMDDFFKVAKETLYFDMRHSRAKAIVVVLPGEEYLPPPPPPVEVKMDKINIEDIRFKK